MDLAGCSDTGVLLKQRDGRDSHLLGRQPRAQLIVQWSILGYYLLLLNDVTLVGTVTLSCYAADSCDLGQSDHRSLLEEKISSAHPQNAFCVHDQSVSSHPYLCVGHPVQRSASVRGGLRSSPGRLVPHGQAYGPSGLACAPCHLVSATAASSYPFPCLPSHHHCHLSSNDASDGDGGRPSWFGSRPVSLLTSDLLFRLTITDLTTAQGGFGLESFGSQGG